MTKIKITVDENTFDKLMSLFDESFETLDESFENFSFDNLANSFDKARDFINDIIKNKKTESCSNSKPCCDCGENCCKDEDDNVEWFETTDEDDEGEDCDEYCDVSDIDHIQ